MNQKREREGGKEEICWWKQAGRLQKSKEGSATAHRGYLLALFTFELVEARGLFVHCKSPNLLVTGMLGHTKK